MSSDGGDWESERPFGARPFGARPFGARPFGARGEDERPFGARPFGARPFGARGDDERPFGARPFGARPFGARPFGARPFGARGGGGGGALDPDEWSGDIGELVCELSAALRVGATAAFGNSEFTVPFANPVAGVRAPGGAGPAAGVVAGVQLNPGEWGLEASIQVPLSVLSLPPVNPELVYAVKVDLAEALAVGLDRAVLEGAAAPAGPQGIGRRRPEDRPGRRRRAAPPPEDADHGERSSCCGRGSKSCLDPLAECPDGDRRVPDPQRLGAGAAQPVEQWTPSRS